MSAVEEYKLLLALSLWLELQGLERASDALLERLDDIWYSVGNATRNSLREHQPPTISVSFGEPSAQG